MRVTPAGSLTNLAAFRATTPRHHRVAVTSDDHGGAFELTDWWSRVASVATTEASP